MPPGGELDPLISQFQHDSHRKREAEALLNLQKIASMVKPIMRQRNWLVGTLAEFYPPERDLLGINVNKGQKICLRLRYPHDENQFLPMEQVVDTMLHELCHNVFGPHDQMFHALWNQLRDEYEALLRKGYTGEGFLGQGNRLGGQRIPRKEALRIARINAEKRRSLAAGSGQRLGGRRIRAGVDPREAIAAAVERRLKIEKGCASETEMGRQIVREAEENKEGVTMTKAQEADANEDMMMKAYIDLVQEEEKEKYGADYVPPSESNPAGMRGSSVSPPSPRTLKAQQLSIEQTINGTTFAPGLRSQLEQASLRPTNSTENNLSTQSSSAIIPPPPRLPTTHQQNSQDTWTCEVCTLVNPFNYLSCDACGVDKPSPPPPRPKQVRRETPNALKPRLNAADSLARIEAQAAYKKSQPVGWTCVCSNFMENEWWTCSACGRMKQSS